VPKARTFGAAACGFGRTHAGCAQSHTWYGWAGGTVASCAPMIVVSSPRTRMLRPVKQVGHAYAATTALYTNVSDDFKNRTLAKALRRAYAPVAGGA
jgi:hypothetical protein